jgi:hypothetical protein
MNLAISQKPAINKTAILAFILTVFVYFVYNVLSQPKIVSTPIQSIYYNQTNAVDTIYPLH